jgi:hypothetical protein
MDFPVGLTSDFYFILWNGSSSSLMDTKFFHQLIKRQRRNNHSIDKMIFKGDEYDDTEGILEGWSSFTGVSVVIYSISSSVNSGS